MEVVNIKRKKEGGSLQLGLGEEVKIEYFGLFE